MKRQDENQRETKLKKEDKNQRETKPNRETISKREKEKQNKTKGIDKRVKGRDNDTFEKSSPDEEGKRHMNIMMEKLFDYEVVGTKALRNDLSSFISKAINNFQEVLTGNMAVKGGKTASILSTEVLEDLLKAYKFEPIINIDEKAGLYEIIIKEIGAAADGDTLEEAIEILVDNIVMLTEDYFEKLEFYKGIENMRRQYPYFLRIKHCKNVVELMEVLGLENLKF